MSSHSPLSPTSSISVHSRHSAHNDEDEARRLTEDELKVLLHTSLINGVIHLPWIGEDAQEPFELTERYKDPMGLLTLSPRQKELHHRWLRPCQFIKHPVMIKRVSSKKISQEVVTNCSFVASLCVCADYERKFKKRIQYLVDYTMDQKIVIDDRIPVDTRNHPLVVTTTEHELWPMLIEKAYLKVQGGYDFPGSNSGIDMHALTGWIPEHVALQDSQQSTEIIWQRLNAGMNSGRALATLATGRVDIIEQDWLWLVPTHAYAIIQAIELPNGIRDDGGDTRMLRCKNPWRQHGWQGQDGQDDLMRWHPRLRRVLSSYMTADAVADGEFWIGWSAVCRYFDTVHLSWDPDQFRHRFTRHAKWPLELGPAFDQHCFAWNPQYSLRVNANEDDEANATVWLLLSRHTEKIETDSSDYITMHVYATQAGERIFYSVEPTAVKGVYVNNPHVLIKLWPKQGEQYYTVVLSQQDRRKTMYYTLKVYANVPFSFRETPGFSYSCQVNGKWTIDTAGGNNNHESWIANPQYRLTVRQSSSVHIMLDLFDVTGKQTTIDLEPTEIDDYTTMIASRIDLFAGEDRMDGTQHRDLVAHSGDYRVGFTYISADLEPGKYALVLSTFDKGTPAPFKLAIASNKYGIELATL
ncbi:hypothetical protein BDF19DRAFT_424684 [Syncephalis fuscata]|nr:hypothetical protein BDF19DRAFT_424684 [Syncephalis fuscata]